MKRVGLVLFLLSAATLVATPAAVAWPDSGKHMSGHRLHMGGGGQQPGKTDRVRVKNFEVLGHTDLGNRDTNGDVWVHGNFAYVGTWAIPCTGEGVKIVDVTDLRAPKLIGRLGARAGTSAEDIVVRRVSTPFFTGDLLAVGLQRCGDDPALDTQPFGTEFWDVTNPYAPTKLGEANATLGGGGTHELDLFQRGSKVVALLANPFREWFDPIPRGDLAIVDATNPRMPVEVAEWGAGAHGLSPGPFFGMGSFGASFDHSARASADGTKAYMSYWDLGVLTLDITDLTNPTLVGRTQYPHGQDGDAHSMTPYQGASRSFILQNDEDFDPRSPAEIRYDRKGKGLGNESPGGTALWLERGHRLNERVVMAANQGCEAGDYPAGTAGKIAVVYTPFPFFDPEGGEEPLCEQQTQEAAAAAAGAAAVVHDFVSTATSPQWFDFGEVDIPVLFTDHATAQGMVAAGRATLIAKKPSWGYLRVFDAATGVQVATFDNLPGVHKLPAPTGDFSIHNTEVVGNRAYVSWYSNGVVALDLTPLDRLATPKLVGSFIPPAAPSRAGFAEVTDVWGVVIRPSDNVIFASDMNSGLWIVRATGPAAP
jgi:hypothetical protein